jgi:hypothetical protein
MKLGLDAGGYSVVGVVYALVVVTPFCGFAFACGCDWPWNGLAAHCNYFFPEAAEKCPWCRHTPVGVLAVVGAALVGAYAPRCFIGRARRMVRRLSLTAAPPAFLMVWAALTKLVY